MPDRPIIFSAPMVRALLEGRKTQTRRVLKPQPPCDEETGRAFTGTFHGPEWYTSTAVDRHGEEVPGKEVFGIYGDDWGRRIPYATGDRLYVREAHALVPSSAYRMSAGVPYAVNPDDPDRACIYRDGWERSRPGTGWRPSIHMPRWASRLTLTVTDVRVQRLQDISEADAVAEGIERLDGSKGPNHFTREITGKWSGSFNAPTAQEVFADLWNSIHPPIIRRSAGSTMGNPAAWDANPWVVALTFTVQNGNIDRTEGTTP